MTAAEIFTLARLKAYTDSSQYSDATLLPSLNIRYHEIENAIVSLKEDYFYDVLSTDTVGNQQRYNLKSSSATVEWVKKVINTYVKWATTDQYPIKLTLGNTDNDSRSLEEIASSQPKDSWFFMIRWWETIIYPTPLNAVVWWLKQEVIVNLKDLGATTAEVDIFATSVDSHTELRQYHYIMALWLAADIFGFKWMFNEKMQLDNDYNIALSKLTSQISDRYTSPIEWSLLDVSQYK